MLRVPAVCVREREVSSVMYVQHVLLVTFSPFFPPHQLKRGRKNKKHHSDEPVWLHTELNLGVTSTATGIGYHCIMLSHPAPSHHHHHHHRHQQHRQPERHAQLCEERWSWHRVKFHCICGTMVVVVCGIVHTP